MVFGLKVKTTCKTLKTHQQFIRCEENKSKQKRIEEEQEAVTTDWMETWGERPRFYYGTGERKLSPEIPFSGRRRVPRVPPVPVTIASDSSDLARLRRSIGRRQKRVKAKLPTFSGMQGIASSILPSPPPSRSFPKKRVHVKSRKAVNDITLAQVPLLRRPPLGHRRDKCPEKKKSSRHAEDDADDCVCDGDHHSESSEEEEEEDENKDGKTRQESDEPAAFDLSHAEKRSRHSNDSYSRLPYGYRII